MFSGKHGSFGIYTAPTLIMIFKYENIKLKKRMSSGRCLPCKQKDKIIERPSISHETIPLIKLMLINRCYFTTIIFRQKSHNVNMSILYIRKFYVFLRRNKTVFLAENMLFCIMDITCPHAKSGMKIGAKLVRTLRKKCV
jgi:hypothetical protein